MESGAEEVMPASGVVVMVGGRVGDGVLVTVGVWVWVNASKEADDGSSLLNKHTNTPAANNRTSKPPIMRQRVFKVL